MTTSTEETIDPSKVFLAPSAKSKPYYGKTTYHIVVGGKSLCGTGANGWRMNMAVTSMLKAKPLPYKPQYVYGSDASVQLCWNCEYNTASTRYVEGRGSKAIVKPNFTIGNATPQTCVVCGFNFPSSAYTFCPKCGKKRDMAVAGKLTFMAPAGDIKELTQLTERALLGLGAYGVQVELKQEGW